MQMNRFRAILVWLTLKYIPCSLKRCIIHVCILNGYKVMQFWDLKGTFRTTAIIYYRYRELHCIIKSGFHLQFLITLEKCFLHTRPEFPWSRPMLRNVVLHEGLKTTLVHDVRMTILTCWCYFWHLDVMLTSICTWRQVVAKRFNVNVLDRNRTEHLLIEKCSYFHDKFDKITHILA